MDVYFRSGVATSSKVIVPTCKSSYVGSDCSTIEHSNVVLNKLIDGLSAISLLVGKVELIQRASIVEIKKITSLWLAKGASSCC